MHITGYLKQYRKVTYTNLPASGRPAPNMAAAGKSSVVFLSGKLLKHIFYSDTLYSGLQKTAEKERKYKAD